MTDSAYGCVHVVVEGIVQGVGFRWSAERVAEGEHLHGWIRNTEIGTVEILAEGRSECLERFLEWLDHGPPGARVTGKKVETRPYSNQYRGFSIEG